MQNKHEEQLVRQYYGTEFKARLVGHVACAEGDNIPESIAFKLFECMLQPKDVITSYTSAATGAIAMLSIAHKEFDPRKPETLQMAMEQAVDVLLNNTAVNIKEIIKDPEFHNLVLSMAGESKSSDNVEDLEMHVAAS